MLTRLSAEPYNQSPWRAAVLTVGVPSKPSLDRVKKLPSNRELIGFGGSLDSKVEAHVSSKYEGLAPSGCLKSESEERETWTAESLRAVSDN